MARNTVNTTVSIEPPDALFLSWASGINASDSSAKHWPSRWPIETSTATSSRSSSREALTDTNRDLDDLLDQTSSIEGPERPARIRPLQRLAAKHRMNDPPSDSASDAPATEPTATDSQPSEFLFSRRLKATLTRAPPRVISLSMGIAFLVVAVGPAAAQNQVGDVYCNTGVATGIDLVFGAIAGLGLPATAFYIGTAGLSYMRAGGNPERRRTMPRRNSLCPASASASSSLHSSHPNSSIRSAARWDSASQTVSNHFRPI